MKKKIISIVLIVIFLLTFTKIIYADNAEWYKLASDYGTYYYTTENRNNDTVYWVSVDPTTKERTIAELTYNKNTDLYEYRGTDDLKFKIEAIPKYTFKNNGLTTTSEYYFKMKAIMEQQSKSSVTMTKDEYDNFIEEDKENREFAYEYWENYQKNQEQKKDYTKQEVNLKEVDLDKIVTDANSFLDKGSQVDEDDTISEEKIQDLSNLIYNVLLVIGIVVPSVLRPIVLLFVA